MEYAGRYKAFDADAIETYPVSGRTNKVSVSDLVAVDEVLKGRFEVGQQAEDIAELARGIVRAAGAGRAVIWLTGAHLIKNGLSPLLVDLLKRKVVSLVATTGAGIIHDFELALFGATSEDVPNSLPEGKFGMAYELSYINAALTEANDRKLGYGEGIGMMMHDDEFRSAVQKRLGLADAIDFRHTDISVIGTCYQMAVPLTAHVGVGADVTDQHANFDGCAKGGCSARDFLIFTNEVPNLADGGVFLNIGCAVTGPEVLLKAVSMAGNVGKPPYGLTTADFDLKTYDRGAMADESHVNYYYRDHKSVVTRIPDAFGGKGFYIQGDQRQTIPRLYQEIISLL